MSRTRTQAVLDAVLATLTAAFTPAGETKPKYAIELYPDDPDRYRLMHPHGALLVRQLASSYEEPQRSGNRHASLTSRQQLPQQRTVVIRVTTMFRQLNGADGVTAVVDQATDALAGAVLGDAAGGAWLVADGFEGVDGGVWEHGLDIAVPMWS